MSNRWSCCRYSTNNAWNYNSNGVSNNNNFYNGLTVSAVSEFAKITDMVTLEDLYEVYFLARANKRRSEDSVIFEIDYERRLYNLQIAINERTYRSTSNYTLNSYFGLMKNRNEFRNIIRLFNMISDEWKTYIHLNYDKLCIEANEGYRHRDVVREKFSKITISTQNKYFAYY